ncbi:MAG TPA: glycoside hydrolase family 15 protein, partial [Symbiobacteriaceae bacterium]|nr:glycoside hydrolase family 15 protein [Symbiobacteriaceae bacterium]
MSKAYFGAVGNGETVALVGPDLAVAWWCVPRPDSFPIFASALDPRRGGSLRLHFRIGESHLKVTDASVQRYIDRTNILGTSVLLDDLSVSVLDYMPWGRRYLVRQITLTNLGETREGVRVDFSVSPTRSESAPADLEEQLCVEFKGPNAALLGPGESVTTVLIAAYGESPAEAFDTWSQAEPDALEAEEQFWADWLGKARPVSSGDGSLDEAYYRSLLALKLLCNEKTGAILAAPTASFPAIPGGGDNWDYRYAWLRDGYFISRCLDAAGLHTESRRFYDFALKCQAEDGRFYQTLYTVDGGNPKEFVVSDMAGPGGEKPIRFGNAASDQLQIDSEPNIIHGLFCHWLATGD